VTAPLLVVGDALLDRDLVGTVDRLCPDAPVPVVDEPVETSRPGGAGLAALLAAADGREVVLVTALAQDAPGQELRALLEAAGVQVVDLGLDGTTPEKVRVRSNGRSLLRLDRGGSAGPPGDLLGELPASPVVLVADYGRGVAASPALRSALRGRRVVWDPHPRGPQPVPGCLLITPNGAEAAHFAPGHTGGELAATTARARELAARWSATALAVTLGARGALIVTGDGPPSVVPAAAVPCFDPCGAGDRFASAAAGLLADGALPSEAVAGAVTASTAFVAAGGAAAVRVGSPSPSGGRTATDAFDVAAQVRAGGGTVVATGGCFDLLHAGHVAVLQQARALGDCLVVCLNSDDSVRRLKGPTRPLQTHDDRAAVLLALGCVDAVLVFEQDTPTQVLSQLRPHVWAKGGDYALTSIPEAAAVAGWGGQAVVLPYLDGRSTSSLIREARVRG
jgi:D-beta-D-heptose 7-phosphate kinase/D-beta-D-heptose 1-phosphate adenosyltransferase